MNFANHARSRLLPIDVLQWNEQNDVGSGECDEEQGFWSLRVINSRVEIKLGRLFRQYCDVTTTLKNIGQLVSYRRRSGDAFVILEEMQMKMIRSGLR
jgi:hypothetical protein